MTRPKFRESNLLRQVFESTVERCLKEDLVSGEGFAVDASLIPADANKTRSMPAAEWSPEVARAAGNRAAREYLETLDGECMNATGSREFTNAFGAASESQPKFVAKPDPAAQWTRAEESRPYFAYATNYLVDTKCSVIMDVEGTRAIRQAEVRASQTMIDRTEKRFGIRPDWPHPEHGRCSEGPDWRPLCSYPGAVLPNNAVRLEVAFGQCALARVRYFGTTRTKARVRPDHAGYHAGEMANLAPGLTL